MTNSIQITIDGQALQVPPGITVLEAAQRAHIDIPTLCYHEQLTANAVCRLCVVEISGSRRLAPACATTVQADAVIHTQSPRVHTARRTILEMLAAATDLSAAPELLELMQEYGADPARFGDDSPRRSYAIKDDNPFYIRDYNKCVLCWRCVQVCAEDVQHTFALGFNGRGFHTSIATAFDVPLPESPCVFCGNCVGVCPTGALVGKRELTFLQPSPAPGS